MLNSIKIDRKKLAEYIKQYADVMALTAEVSIDTETIKSMCGDIEFIQTVNIDIKLRNIQPYILEPK